MFLYYDDLISPIIIRIIIIICFCTVNHNMIDKQNLILFYTLLWEQLLGMVYIINIVITRQQFLDDIGWIISKITLRFEIAEI